MPFFSRASSSQSASTAANNDDGNNATALPPPPPAARSFRTASTGRNSSTFSNGRSASLVISNNSSNSMTIDEMRAVHQQALREAEAKRTELRLVLASRYRELVGSSDEVIKMKERAQELHSLVTNLPTLIEKLKNVQLSDGSSDQETKISDEEIYHRQLVSFRRILAQLPRDIHRALDKSNVHEATTTLIRLFSLIASQTDAYPIANALASPMHQAAYQKFETDTTALSTQMRMVYLHVHTLTRQIRIMARDNVLTAASTTYGAVESAASLASLDLLKGSNDNKQANTFVASNDSSWLVDLYYESKAKLVSQLLGELKLPQDDGTGSNDAEQILLKIVLILQYDVILHPFQIFVLRALPTNDNDTASQQAIMDSLSMVDTDIVKNKCSKFLSSHLPLIRTKVKSILMTIAGTTASALGQIRQSLYDKTDGLECINLLNANGICTWQEAVSVMVDSRQIHDGFTSGPSNNDRGFSLWSALFSNTFSSLVHSILTTSFHSVHTKVVSTLRASLANAPPCDVLLPHEAYRNTLQIATNLDQALIKVSDDAHELLVHAEEREESERRLKQSLYVQTCEVMGRLLCELRRMASDTATRGDAVRELLVGRLCFLLKFRLTCLPTLLDSSAAHFASPTATGLISYIDLQSAFELADDDDDGLITFEEAMQAVESAFSGTKFSGTEMVKETLLIPSQQRNSVSSNTPMLESVTLNELALLTARGLRHGKSGMPESALGIVQKSLDFIIHNCFSEWATLSLAAGPTERFEKSIQDLVTLSNQKSSSNDSMSVSPSALNYLLEIASILNKTICPPDLISPSPSTEYAVSMCVISPESGEAVIERISDALCKAMTKQLISTIAVQCKQYKDKNDVGDTAQAQIATDFGFLRYALFDANSFRDGLKYSQDDFDSIVEFLAKYDKIGGEAQRTSMFKFTIDSTQIILSVLLGTSTATTDDSSAVHGNDTLYKAPLSSNRRFEVLPVQSDRSIAELQIRGRMAKEKEDAAVAKHESVAGSVVSSGLGFFSSMLKKK